MQPAAKRCRLGTADGQPVGNDVAESVLRCWAQLGKNGKPQPHEHTVLAGAGCWGRHAGVFRAFITADAALPPAAGIAITVPQCSSPVTVAIGTGTKCLGASKLCDQGTALGDSHAEVIARRALQAWLYSQLHLACGAALDALLAVLHAAASPQHRMDVQR